MFLEMTTGYIPRAVISQQPAHHQAPFESAHNQGRQFPGIDVPAGFRLRLQQRRTLLVTLRASNSTLAPWQTQRTKDEKCKLTKLVIRIASGFRLKRCRKIDYVLLMVDGEYPSPVHLHFNGCLVAIRNPKAINLLILPYKISSIDPEGRLFSRVARDFHNRKVFCIDPNFPVEQILVFAFRRGFENQAMIWADFLLPGQLELVVRGRDRAVMMLATGRGFASALHQPIEHQMTHNPGSFFGGLIECLLAGRLIIDTHHCLSRDLSLEVSDLVGAQGRISLQLLVPQAVALQHFSDDVVARQTHWGRVARRGCFRRWLAGEALALCKRRRWSRSQDKSEDDPCFPLSNLNCHIRPPL